MPRIPPRDSSTANDSVGNEYCAPNNGVWRENGRRARCARAARVRDAVGELRAAMACVQFAPFGTGNPRLRISAAMPGSLPRKAR